MSSRAKHLWEVLCTAYGVLGLGRACGEDEVFAAGAGSGDRAGQQAGLDPGAGGDRSRRRHIRQSSAGCRSMQPPSGGSGWRRPAQPCRFGSGDPGDLRMSPRCTSRPIRATGSASPGSPRSRLEPQITVGLLTDARGFPLMVHGFEGDRAETKTILPVVQAFARPISFPR